MNWWLDAIPEDVFARGNLDFYGRENAVARGDKALTGYERYTGEAAAEKDPFRFDLRDGGDLESLYLRAEADDGYRRDRNVFRAGIDIYDNMSASLRYRTGALLTYSLVAFAPYEGMRVAFNGDRGRIEYDEIGCGEVNRAQRECELEAAETTSREAIRVRPHFAPGYAVMVPNAKGGHGGADPLLMEQIFAAHPPVDPQGRSAGHEQGAASVLVGIAANISIAEKRPVKLADLVALRPEAVRLSALT